MKSSQSHLQFPGIALGRPAYRKSFATLFAGAMALGLGVSSLLAQGPYYPGVATVPGTVPVPVTNPFNPNGIPVTTSFEFNLIESQLTGGATLVAPPAAGKHTATAAEYADAVKGAANVVASGGGGAVTIASLATEVAGYRSDLFQVTAALGKFAEGILAAAVPAGTKQTSLEALAFNAAKANPSQLVGINTILKDVFVAAAGDASVAAGLNLVVSQAVSGVAASTSLGLRPNSLFNVVSNAAAAIVNSSASINKTLILSSIASTTAVNAVVSGTPANLDAITNALTTSGIQPHVPLSAMVASIKAAAGGTNAKDGAIAAGALRTLSNRNIAGYGAIKSGLGNTPYVVKLVNSFDLLAAGNANAAAVASGPGGFPEATAAAAAVKNPNQAGIAVAQILGNGYGSSVRQDIIIRAVSAYQAGAATIADAAVGNGGVTVEEVTYAATLGAQISSAGAIAKAVILKAGINVPNAEKVAYNAIAGAAFISPANKPDGFADISFTLGNTLKANAAASAAAVTQATQAVVTFTTGVAATAPTYIAVVSALAGDQKSNYGAILAAGLGAVVGDDDTATSAGANLVNSIGGVPLNNYQATLTAAAGATTNAQALAVVYAASLANASDAIGGLAALIANTNTSPADLTAAAISANRSRQATLSLAAEVAVHTKATPDDIQAYLGRQIIANPAEIREITTAATVVAPQFSHFIAHAVAYNNPRNAHNSIAGIFLHSKVSFLTTSNANIVNDRPAAVAAITAGLTTGILESTQLSPTDRSLALRNAIGETVKAIISPVYNDATAGPATFLQSNGLGGSSPIKAKGVAGGITGFVAQLVNPGDTTVTAELTNALNNAMAQANILTGTAHILDIAQAAGQAFGWVSGTLNRFASPLALNAIATAIQSAVPAYSFARVNEAVAFGIDQAAGGTGAPGAGAAGLSNIPGQFYLHHSASGTPVSNIFSL